MNNCVKHLAFHIDQKLTWKNHIKTEGQQLDLKTVNRKTFP